MKISREDFIFWFSIDIDLSDEIIVPFIITAVIIPNIPFRIGLLWFYN